MAPPQPGQNQSPASDPALVPWLGLCLPSWLTRAPLNRSCFLRLTFPPGRAAGLLSSWAIEHLTNLQGFPS